MKKYIYFVIIFIFLLLIMLQIDFKSYAYQDCSNYIENPEALNSLNLIKYIHKNYSNADINYFCTYNNCYYLKNENISNALKKYLTLQENKGLEEYVLEASVKGFPITEISFNLCE